MALLAWTMVHGIAELAISGRLPFRTNAEVLKFGEFVIDQSYRSADNNSGDAKHYGDANKAL